jgi:hypothetical protein
MSGPAQTGTVVAIAIAIVMARTSTYLKLFFICLLLPFSHGEVLIVSPPIINVDLLPISYQERFLNIKIEPAQERALDR